MTRIMPVIALGFLITPFSLYASPASYSINTQKTTIALAWHAFGGTSEASLEKVTGNITLDTGNERGDRIDVTIPVDTLKASNTLLTYQMKSHLFFDAAHYPNIAFTSSRVVALGKGHFRVFGTLAVKNVTRPVILDASLESQHGELSGAENIFLHASTAISRSAFNMDSFAALVDDTVTITIEIQARPHQAV
ncbi:YceI family protein [Kosakonia oryzendophytica]|uniref:YceI family protein n=1 Tax=Kosakonia TaxID=1330547 RepID=UPI000776C889|nr:YceI family protein [Kosakonia oryzendophytica]AMO47430.1 YceI family protein [Enterobacter sp. FY-07]TDT57016.1 polyisoprenoid-binding protein YceI [Enterobacter sp. AG5470]WBT59152.1 YceI family protein [Kosakonia oryzendophytica]